MDDLFPPLKTKEDYVAWLKITKKYQVNAYNFPTNLGCMEQNKKLVIFVNLYQKLCMVL